jgi:hypothetical protein
MSDNAAIAAAIALRWTTGAGFVTPTNQPALVAATEQLPTGIPGLPVLLVFPPEEPELKLVSQTRLSLQAYPVRLLLVAEPSDPTDIVALYAWHKASQDRILTQTQLGRAGEVALAWISAIRPGVVAYEGSQYLGLDMTVSVKTSEPISPVA